MPLLSNGPARMLGRPRRPPVPVPQLGPELIVNGGFDADANWSKGGGWTIGGGVATYAPAGGALLGQAGVLVAGGWYSAQFSVAAYASNSIAVAFGNATMVGVYRSGLGIYQDTGRSGGTALNFYPAPAASLSIDNVSVRQITLSSMFSASAYGTHRVTRARVTVALGCRAGVVCNMDSATNPQNFVIASHNGQTARLTKCVAGTYTELISQSVAYVAGAFVEVRRLAGTDTWQLFYNGAQVGNNQTISDAGIVGNTLHGYFNTYSGNVLSEFSCVAA